MNSPLRIAGLMALLILPAAARAQHSCPAERFAGTIGRTLADSTPALLEPARPAPEAPDIVYIVLDDTGYSDLGVYGSDVATPHMDALARGGLQYTRFHSKAICSPTRASLLTGRNNHAVGMKQLAGRDGGYPHSRGRIPRSAATIAQLLQSAGYATLAAGKWHLTPGADMGAAGPKRHWPLQNGFERFYGFLSGWTDQYHPDLVRDNHATNPPEQEGYHFSEDIVSESMRMLDDIFVDDSEEPFFLYLGFGATHAPIQIPKSYVEKYADAFDRGWDVIRRERFERQIALGLFPADAALPARNPGDPAWADLSDVERTV